MTWWQRNKWRIGWLSWLGMFAAIEGHALLNKTKGDTLSEHVWRWFSVREKSWGWRARRTALLAFTTWLTAHFVSGGRLV